jgi:hypothetical protein
MRIIHQIFDDHHLLLANFWKGVKVSIKNNKYTFIPESLYHPKISRLCLELNTSYDEDTEEIFHHYSRNHKLWTVFSADKAFIDLISEVYPRVSYKIVHQSSVLVEGFQAINGSTENTGMFIFIDRFVLHIAIQRQNELFFFNSFQIRQFDDYQRYISMAASQYHLHPVNSPVKVWGFMSDQTNNYRELQKKIPGLEPGLRPVKIKLSHAFDEIPENFYFDLFSMPYLTD